MRARRGTGSGGYFRATATALLHSSLDSGFHLENKGTWQGSESPSSSSENPRHWALSDQLRTESNSFYTSGPCYLTIISKSALRVHTHTLGPNFESMLWEKKTI